MNPPTVVPARAVVKAKAEARLPAAQFPAVEGVEAEALKEVDQVAVMVEVEEEVDVLMAVMMVTVGRAWVGAEVAAVIQFHQHRRHLLLLRQQATGIRVHDAARLTRHR